MSLLTKRSKRLFVVGIVVVLAILVPWQFVKRGTLAIPSKVRSSLSLMKVSLYDKGVHPFGFGSALGSEACQERLQKWIEWNLDYNGWRPDYRFPNTVGISSDDTGVAVTLSEGNGERVFFTMKDDWVSCKVTSGASRHLWSFWGTYRRKLTEQDKELFESLNCEECLQGLSYFTDEGFVSKHGPE